MAMGKVCVPPIIKGAGADGGRGWCGAGVPIGCVLGVAVDVDPPASEVGPTCVRPPKNSL